MRALRRYTEEFKSDALAVLTRSELSLTEVATNLGVPHWTLRSWYKSAEMAKKQKKKKPSSASRPRRFVSEEEPKEETEAERITRLEGELKALRRENESLKVDREILKKAAATFVKESE